MSALDTASIIVASIIAFLFVGIVAIAIVGGINYNKNN